LYAVAQLATAIVLLTVGLDEAGVPAGEAADADVRIVALLSLCAATFSCAL
jgi:hypothetical protein